MEVVRDECERKILSFSEEEKRGGCVVRDEGVRSEGMRVMDVFAAGEAEVEKENKRLIKVIDTMR